MAKQAKTFDQYLDDMTTFVASVVRQEKTAANTNTKGDVAAAGMVAKASSVDKLAVDIATILSPVLYIGTKKDSKGETVADVTTASRKAFQRISKRFERALKAANYRYETKTSGEAKKTGQVGITISELPKKTNGNDAVNNKPTSADKADREAESGSGSAGRAESASEPSQMGAPQIAEHAAKLSSEGQRLLIQALLRNGGMNAADVKKVASAAKAALAQPVEQVEAA